MGAKLSATESEPERVTPLPMTGTSAPEAKSAGSELTIAGGGGTTDNTRFAVPVPLAFTAPRLTLNVPETAGVPETIPVAVSTIRLEGNPVALKLVGLLLASI